MDVDTVVDDEECYICESKLETDEEKEVGMCMFCAEAKVMEYQAVRRQKEPKPIRGNWQ